MTSVPHPASDQIPAPAAKEGVRTRVRTAVIIPCFNDGATLEDAVASAQRQEDCEIVVVDDGSTDQTTIEVIARLKREGIGVVRQENKGLPHARNLGLRLTSAAYVFPLDADDMLAPGGLAVLGDMLDSHSSACAAWGDTLTFGDIEQHRRKNFPLDPWRITYLNELGYSALFRRDALDSIGGWYLERGFEDWDVWMSLAEQGCSGVSVPEVTLLFRLHGPRMWSDSVKEHDRLYGEMRRRHPHLFANRSANWRRARAPWRMKLLFPPIEAAPGLSSDTKRRLRALVRHPLMLARWKLTSATRPHAPQ